MKYLIIAPTEREYRNITRALEKRTTENQYLVTRCGVGKALAAANTALAIAQLNGELKIGRASCRERVLIEV